MAKFLAKELGYIFIDSGAMYRAVTLYLMRNNLSLQNVKQNPEILNQIKIRFIFNELRDFYEIYLNDVLVENDIRGMEVANFVSEVSTLKEVRQFLVKQQQQIANQKGVVMDGRDIGTTVIPDAELKIFMTADPIIRARRRFEELEFKQIPASFEDVL